MLEAIWNHFNVYLVLLVLNIHWLELKFLFIIFKGFNLFDICSLFKGLGFHLDIAHWLTDRMVAALLNLVFNIIDVFKLSSYHLNIITSTFTSWRIIITNLGRVIMRLLTRNHTQLWLRLTEYSFLLPTNRLTIHVIRLLLLQTIPNRITLMLFNWRMLTIIFSCFTYRIHFSHLDHIVF